MTSNADLMGNTETNMIEGKGTHMDKWVCSISKGLTLHKLTYTELNVRPL